MLQASASNTTQKQNTNMLQTPVTTSQPQEVDIAGNQKTAAVS